MSREYMRAQSISFFTNRMMHAKISINIGKVPEIVHSWYALSNSWLFCLENFLLYLFLIILVIISCLTSKVVIFNHFPTIFNYSCDIFNPPPSFTIFLLSDLVN